MPYGKRLLWLRAGKGGNGKALIIQFLNGGLANQVFQYIFYRYGQIKNPKEEWVLDDSFFFVHNVHNGYELEKVFGIHTNLLSNTFDPDVWNYMIKIKKEQNKSIPQLLSENDTYISMIAETDTWKQWNPFEGDIQGVPTGEFNPNIIRLNGNIYYHGYWINAEWYNAIKNDLQSELIFSEVNEPQNLDYLRKIHATESCSIHIRRGDYVTLGVSAPDNIYFDWIKEMVNHVPDMVLFVFSDDLNYCKMHMHEIGLDIPKEVIFVEGNQKEKSFRDMQLMSQCKYMINANSSFCYLAAILNKKLKGLISPPNRKI